MPPRKKQNGTDPPAAVQSLVHLLVRSLSGLGCSTSDAAISHFYLLPIRKRDYCSVHWSADGKKTAGKNVFNSDIVQQVSGSTLALTLYSAEFIHSDTYLSFRAA